MTAEPTVDTIRAGVLTQHRYVTKQVSTDPSDGVVVVCRCGDNGEAADHAGVMHWVEEHLDKAIRAAFKGTKYENEYGTRYLR